MGDSNRGFSRTAPIQKRIVGSMRPAPMLIELSHAAFLTLTRILYWSACRGNYAPKISVWLQQQQQQQQTKRIRNRVWLSLVTETNVKWKPTILQVWKRERIDGVVPRESYQFDGAEASWIQWFSDPLSAAGSVSAQAKSNNGFRCH